MRATIVWLVFLFWLEHAAPVLPWIIEWFEEVQQSVGVCTSCPATHSHTHPKWTKLKLACVFGYNFCTNPNGNFAPAFRLALRLLRVLARKLPRANIANGWLRAFFYEFSPSFSTKLLPLNIRWISYWNYKLIPQWRSSFEWPLAIDVLFRTFWLKSFYFDATAVGVRCEGVRFSRKHRGHCHGPINYLMPMYIRTLR